jgi:mono/diheme cytochrome c family protein
MTRWFLVAACLAWAAPGLASTLEAGECVGCHTPKRNAPQARFGNGLGRWNDSQCYGCHAELNEVARLNSQGQRDARYFAVPVREETLVHMATSPLAYMNAPEAVEPPGDVPRVSGERLAAFLRRPTSLSPHEGSRAPRMMAYPELAPKGLSSVAALLSVRLPPRGKAPAALSAPEKQSAEALWTARCGSCHGGARPMAGRGPVALGLYTPEWLQAYAKGRAQAPGHERRMPVVDLSLDEATLLYRWFGEARGAAEAALDADVSRLKLEAAAATAPTVPPAFIPFLFGPFFRQATCVHCHATSPRAAGAFTADASGLAAYVGKKGGEAFWRRLETRALEARHGLVAAKPGMPMAGVELPEQVRGLIARWVLEGCKDPEGKSLCRR